MSCVLQEKLGANCAAFDVNAACSGFVYAMDIALGYFARKACKNILIVSAEAMSKLVDWTDRSTCVLFGDGAGAVVLTEGDDLLSIKITATGSDLLAIPNVEGNCPFSLHAPKASYLKMNGQGVFKFAVNAIRHDLVDVIEQAGIDEEAIDLIILHQANQRITEAAKKMLKIPGEKYYEKHSPFR